MQETSTNNSNPAGEILLQGEPIIVNGSGVFPGFSGDTPIYRETMERTPRGWEASQPRAHARVFNAAEEEELDELSARLATLESLRPEPLQKKKMEAVKESKSVYKHRFSDAPWFEWLKKKEVIVLGVGGIGSWVTFALARIGCALHIYDMDTIEPHNLGGQLYPMHQIGQNKAESMRILARDFSGGESDITTYGCFDEDSPIGPIVISCFDNMASRSLAFQKWTEVLASDAENASNYLFIDGRLMIW